MHIVDTSARVLIKIVNVLLNIVVACALVLLFVVGVYGLWDNHLIEAEGRPDVWQEYSPVEDSESFEELQALNGDVQAWLTLYGTRVDYPVLYNEDEWRYLNRSPKGEYSLAGSLFFDSQTLPDLQSFPTVIYGHHMDHGAMFGQLDDFTDQSFLNSHRYGNYYYNGTNYGVEIVGLLHTDAYNHELYRPRTLNTYEQRENYYQMLVQSMLVKRNVPLADGDRLLLMSTCASDETNGRTVLVAKVSDDTFEDTFVDEINEGSGLTDTRGWFGVPMLAWYLLAVVLLLVGLTVVVKYIQRRRREDVFVVETDTPQLVGDYSRE